MAKKQQYNGKAKEELARLAQTKRDELQSLRFGSAGSKNKNVKAARALRKDIARVLTALNQK